MCGIIGIYWKNTNESPERICSSHSVCEEMLESLHFRGPDERNVVRSGSALLGHTRLSIIDLETGTQPIFNENSTIAVVLNGEIYNYLDLRLELEKKGHTFRTKTDTEVIVHLYEEVGEDVFSRLNGMFAIIIYDKVTNTILGARDRTGEKPFLYSELPELFVFSSEIKAILKLPDISRDLDAEGIALYLNSLVIPAPYTAFRAIKKLKPAHYLKIKGDNLYINKYWDPRIEIDWEMKEEQANWEFQQIFSDAVKIRTISDVPLGVFLSGGIDSSAVVAFMTRSYSGKVRTFSVGFADEIDERPFARMVAERYNTDHTELYVDQKIEDTVLDVLNYYDEPFGDSSSIPSYLISKEARRHVKVILTGDGGDELFAGYDTYVNQKYQLFDRVSSRLYHEVGKAILKLSGIDIAAWVFPKRSWSYAYAHWHVLRSYYSEEEIQHLLPVQGGFIKRFFSENKWLDVASEDALSMAYSYDLNWYLPDDLLKKIDMASMFASLECRAPFLDHRLVEFSLKIPPHMKVKNDITKYILKQALKEYLPNEILKRTKTGFGAPIESWMRNQLREVIFDFILPGCKLESLVPREAINEALNRVYSVSRCKDYRTPYKLWLLFVLEVWMRRYSS